MWCDLPTVQIQHARVSRAGQDSPPCTTSGRSTKHFVPFCALSVSGSGLIGSTRLLGSVSRLAVSSLRHLEMSLGLKMRAAEVRIVFWKKVRSSTFMARFTGGVNMSSADMDEDCICRVVWLLSTAWDFFLVISRTMTQGSWSGTRCESRGRQDEPFTAPRYCPRPDHIAPSLSSTLTPLPSCQSGVRVFCTHAWAG
jgi:hypothetical protein